MQVIKPEKIIETISNLKTGEVYNTTIKNKKTGEVYKDEEALKAANIPTEDVQRDVTVIMPKLDLFGKTK
jgi:hypothetical protein